MCTREGGLWCVVMHCTCIEKHGCLVLIEYSNNHDRL